MNLTPTLDKMSKTVRDKFEKKNPREHVLLRPDMYIGSVQNKEIDEFVCRYDKIIRQRITFNDGLARIGLEPLYNAVDNYFRCKGTKFPQKSMIVDIDKTSMTVYNDGAGIPVEESNEAGLLIPELIFGELLAGSNFNDNEQRDGIGGRNGVGVKATNIYSKVFKLETFDPNSGKLMTKTWTNNMGKSTPPVVKSKKAAKGYTRVSFEPDFERFGVDEFTDDMIAFFERVAYEISLSTGMTVTFNGKSIKVRSLEHYATFFVLGKKPSVKFTSSNSTFLIVDCNDRIVTKRTSKDDEDDVADLIDEPVEETEEVEESTDEELVLILKKAIESSRGCVVSLVNGIYTRRGGAHVDEWMDRILPLVVQKLKKRFPKLTAKKIRSKLMFFVTAQLINPTFDTQSKDLLTAPKPDVPKLKVEDPLIGRVAKLPFVSHLKDDALEEDRKEQSKTDAKKDSHLKVPKAINASLAKPGSSRCTLILTEGDSAAGTALNALEAIPDGHKLYGIFPLRGKLLNTRNRTAKDINENVEIQAIKNLVGLHHEADYSDDAQFDKLNYKRVWIMTDQDYDGDHIRGLILNYFAYTYPTLLGRSDFAVSVITPIMKLVLKDKQKTQLTFYDLEKARQWLIQNKDVPKQIPKYIKGLGTLDYEAAIDYFEKPKTVAYDFEPDRDAEFMELFFDKRKANDRKLWLRQDKLEALPYDIESIGSISVKDFVNYELKRYALRSNQRMLPSVMDGLKECQRKVVYAAFKRNLTKSIKVVQLAGYIAEHTAYLHGEGNLEDTIVKMAVSYIGSNNVPLLVDDGQFGSYFFGGKDAAAGRYIHTCLNMVTRKLFHSEDDDLLTYLEEEDISIEPEWYMPILPLILLNGCRAGIGTGYSSSVANYNPKDVAEAVLRWLDSDNPDEEDFTLTPWFLGFKGDVQLLKSADDQVIGYETRGVMKHSTNEVVIEELPVPLSKSGKFPHIYMEMLKEWLSKKTIKKFTHGCTKYSAKFNITPAEKALSEKDLQLVSKDTTTNMVLLDREGNPRRFKSVSEIIRYWCPMRLEFYDKRKLNMMKKLKALISEINNRIRFIQQVNDDEIVLRNRKHDQVVADLKEKEYDMVNDSYDYLLNMHIASLTSERIDKLKEELKKREKEYKALKKTNVKDMWKQDIQAFLDTYAVFVKELEAKLNKVKARQLLKTTSLQEVKKKRTTKKK